MPGFENFYEQASPEELQLFGLMSTLERSLFEYNIDPNMLIEMIINDVMMESRKFEIRKRREERDFEDKFEIRIQFLESQIELYGDSLQLEMRAQELRRELNTLRENKANQITLDREAEFKRYGERPTRYFCNLEKYNTTQ